MIAELDTSALREATATLLWEACRLPLTASTVTEAVDGGADLDLASQAAIVHGVGPLLWRALGAAGVDEDRAEGLRVLRSESDFRRAQAMLLLPEAVALSVQPLTSAGLEPVVFKGPTLAARYAEPGLRPMVDIDIVLPPDQHDVALHALGDSGWAEVQRSGQHHDTCLSHRAIPDLHLELHRDLYVWHNRATQLTAAGLWEHRRPVSCMGVDAFGLPPDVELAALAAHAGKPDHQFSRLIWSVDIAVVLAADPDVDLACAAARAKEWGCETALAVALGHAARLGAEVPADALDMHVGRFRRAALDPLLAETWPMVDHDDGLNRRLRYALWDSRSRRAALFFGDVVVAGPRYVPQRAATLVGFGLRRAWRSVRSS